MKLNNNNNDLHARRQEVLESLAVLCEHTAVTIRRAPRGEEAVLAGILMITAMTITNAANALGLACDE